MPDDKEDSAAAREERARKLREQIDELRKGTKPPPKTPRDFVHEKMREQEDDESDGEP